MVQLVLLLPQNGRRVFIVGEPCAYYSLRLQPQWKRRRCGLGAVHPLEAHMGAVSHSRGPAGSRTRLTRARATAGSSGRVWGATLSAGQPRGPRTLTYECRARDADTGAGRAGVATDGPAQCSTFATVAIAGWAIATSGPKKRSLDAVCWTSVGHVMPTRAPGGPAFRQWSRLVPCVRHIAWSNGRCRHDIPP